MTDPRTGLTVVHRRYVPWSSAHYAGSLVDGAYGLGLFGDAATLTRVGTRSRTIDFQLLVVTRGRPDLGVSAAEVLDKPLLATSATGVVVVPPATDF